MSGEADKIIQLAPAGAWQADEPESLFCGLLKKASRQDSTKQA